jgi:hypothetical protein
MATRIRPGEMPELPRRKFNQALDEKLELTGGTMTGVIGLASFQTDDVPTPTAASLIFVPNESGGPTVAFADGLNFRRVQDRVILDGLVFLGATVEANATVDFSTRITRQIRAKAEGNATIEAELEFVRLGFKAKLRAFAQTESPGAFWDQVRWGQASWDEEPWSASIKIVKQVSSELSGSATVKAVLELDRDPKEAAANLEANAFFESDISIFSTWDEAVWDFDPWHEY